MIARAAVLALLACLLSGCTVFPTEPEEITFKYTPYGGDDHYDQLLEIDNDGLGAVRTTLDITPLDAAGHEIPGVTVTSAFGANRGKQVIPAYFTDYDVLKFDGERASEVRDVRVRIAKLEQVSYPEMSEAVTYERFDDGRAVADDEPFDSIELTNPNEDDMPVRIALMTWNRPPKDAPQQYEWAIPLDDVVTVPAKRRKMVRLPPDLADRLLVTIETYGDLPSHPEDAVADAGEWRVRAGREREP